MQFRGAVRPGQVGLQVYLTKTTFPYPELPNCPKDVDAEPLVPCKRCGQSHSQLYILWRKPRGMLGCWVVFRYNGEDHVPDLSCPHGVEKLPRDAQKLTAEENAAEWHKE